MSRLPYPAVLADEQGVVPDPMIPASHKQFTSRKADMREGINGIFYPARNA